VSKTPAEIRSLARSHGESAIRTLANIMCNQDAQDNTRIAAANSLLDRGYGKATQPIGGEDGAPIKTIAEIAWNVYRSKEAQAEGGGDIPPATE
jgi:hypothetical protein